jgi:hypothetical protein
MYCHVSEDRATSSSRGIEKEQWDGIQIKTIHEIRPLLLRRS